MIACGAVSGETICRRGGCEELVVADAARCDVADLRNLASHGAISALAGNNFANRHRGGGCESPWTNNRTVNGTKLIVYIKKAAEGESEAAAEPEE